MGVDNLLPELGSSFGGYGVLGALGFIGIISSIIYFISKGKLNKSKLGLEKFKSVTEYKNKKSIETIEKIDDTEVKLKAQIEGIEESSEETKKRIDTILYNTREEVKKVIKESKEKPISNIVNDINNNWGDM